METLIVAHRGTMTEAPENTKAAFDRAVYHRVDGIEFDVQITRDRQPVVFHDASLQKINGSIKSIPDCTLDELTGYDWGGWFSDRFKNEKILTLSQVLREYGPKIRLMIEIKPAPRPEFRNLYYELADMVVEMIGNLVPRDQISNMYILSFDPEIIKSAYMNGPELNYVLNLHTSLIDKDHLNYDPVNIDPEILCGCCIEHTLLDKRFVERLHDDNRMIMTYSCNSVQTLKRLLALDVDVIMTDDPGSSMWKEFDL